MATPFSWELQSVEQAHIRYVVVDFRKRSQDSITGEFLNQVPPAAPIDRDYKPGIASLWDGHAARVYDSGNVIVFDLDRTP
jgi:hypothetical protein